MRTLYWMHAVFVGLAVSASAGERLQPGEIAAAVSPLLDEQAVMVIHGDYGGLDARGAAEQVGRLAGAQAGAVVAALQPVVAAIEALQAAGTRGGFFVVSVADLPKCPGFIAVPLPSGADAQRVAAVLKERPLQPGFVAERAGAVMVSAAPETWERLKRLAPDPRPELAEALAAAGDSRLSLVFIPPSYFRPVIEQTLPELPAAVGGGPSTILTAGVQWAAAGITLEPQPRIRIVVRSQSPEAAASLAEKLRKESDRLGKDENVRKHFPPIDRVLALLVPTVEKDRLVLELSDENGKLSELIGAVMPR